MSSQAESKGEIK